MVPKGDEEYAFSDSMFVNRGNLQRTSRSRNKCFVYALFLFVILCAIILIFSLVALRPTPPTVRLTSVSVKTLRYGGNNDNNSSAAWFNGTLSGDVMIRNDNFGRFEFGNASATVSYGYDGVVVGGVNLEGGSVEAKGLIKRGIMVLFKSNGSIDSDKLNGDASKNGTLEISVYARLVGKMRLVRIFEFRRTSVLNCTISLNLGSSSVRDLVCQ